MNQLGATYAVDHLDARRFTPQVTCGLRQGFAGGNRLVQAGKIVLRDERRHLPIERGRGEHDRCAKTLDGFEQQRRRELFDQHR